VSAVDRVATQCT